MKLIKTEKKKSIKPKEKGSSKDVIQEKRNPVNFREVMKKILSVNPKKLAMLLLWGLH